MTSPPLGSSSLRRVPPLTDQEFSVLSSYIYEKTGIEIPVRRKYLLENRLAPRLEELGLTSFDEYTKYLRFGPGRTTELQKLCDQVTTNETSFFRDMKQLDVFRNVILKELLERRQDGQRKELRIWSAGCSSGEEPYTLAIMLHELLRMSIIGWSITITGNDISAAMIEKGRKGIYNEHSLRTTPQEVLSRYFAKEPEGYRIHPKVQKLVSLGQINLNDQTAVKRVPRSQIIFCRNVIIYFDDAMKRKIITAFHDNLLPGGYLVLGHSETIHNLSLPLRRIINPGGIVYRKDE
jgi:chemotaxis protein methyltransferase CheR